MTALFADDASRPPVDVVGSATVGHRFPPRMPDGRCLAHKEARR